MPVEINNHEKFPYLADIAPGTLERGGKVRSVSFEWDGEGREKGFHVAWDGTGVLPFLIAIAGNDSAPGKASDHRYVSQKQLLLMISALQDTYRQYVSEYAGTVNEDQEREEAKNDR